MTREKWLTGLQLLLLTTFTAAAAMPYVNDLTGGESYQIKPLLTVGDEIPQLDGAWGATSVSSSLTFTFSGIPDGLGVYETTDSFWVWVNHEYGTTVTTPISTTVAGSIMGARVSLLQFNKAWQIQAGRNLIETAVDGSTTYTLNLTTGTFEDGTGGTIVFNRFCSGSLAGTGFKNSAGQDVPVWFAPEEGGSSSRGWAVYPDGKAVALNGLGRFSQEQVIAASQYRAGAGQTILLSTEDNGDGEIYLFKGTQTVADPNGFADGQLFVLRVRDTANAVLSNELMPQYISLAAEWVPVPSDTVAAGGSSLSAYVNAVDESGELRSTNFQRPEDIDEDPSNPGTFYFATTGGDSTNNTGRLYRLTLNAADPTAAGTVTMLVKGGPDTGVSYDNLTVDSKGRVIVQEDRSAGGGMIMAEQGRQAQIFAYDIAANRMEALFELNQAEVVPADAEDFGKWESSGIVETSPGTLIAERGRVTYLFDVQAHGLAVDGHVEGGQLVLALPSQTGSGAVSLTPTSTYFTGSVGVSAAEIVGYDAGSKRAFFTNSQANTVTIVDSSNPDALTKIADIALTPYGDNVNSVAVHNGLVAVAIQKDSTDETGADGILDTAHRGVIAFFDIDGAHLATVTVGFLPDMVTFTPDGGKVLVANEGEPVQVDSANEDWDVNNDGIPDLDPPGSISIIPIPADVTTLTDNAVIELTFSAYDGRTAELRNRGIRIFPGALPGTDFEPEYIAVSPDGTQAMVTLQEANALAAIDLTTNTLTDILPLGWKDHSRGPATLSQYTLSNTPDIANATGPALTAPDGDAVKLGGFSGLHYTGMVNGKMRFVTVPDRGPNPETYTKSVPNPVLGGNSDVTARPFGLPDYEARLVMLDLDPATGALTVADQLFLTRQDGANIVPITGLSNVVFSTTGTQIDEFPVDANGNAVAVDPFGGDLEGVRVDAAGNFWLCDEYRPAVYKFDPTGLLIARFVPAGTAATAGMPVGTYGSETFPAAYAKRWRNRGFEAIAIDNDANTVYAFIQSPIEDPSQAAVRNKSDVIRILGLDMTTGQPVSEYVYLLERNANAGVGVSRVDKMGDAVYIGNGRMLVLERDSATTVDGKKYIFEIDLLGATDVLDTTLLAAGKTLEEHSADLLAAQGIRPVFKRKVLNLPSLGYVAGDKTEGIDLLPDGRIVVLNDNDFGVEGTGIVMADGAPTGDILFNSGAPSVLGIIAFADGNTLDGSDRDVDGSSGAGGRINLQNWPVLGIYMPDTIAAFAVNGKTYYATANEGDARDAWGEEGRLRGDLTLDDANFPNATTLRDNAVIGRLKVSTIDGDLDGDGDHDRIFSYGARSFSIFDAYGNLVFDSSDDFERIIAQNLPTRFNSSHSSNASFDSRSDDKGPEPEAIAIGQIDDRAFAFIGLERQSLIMVYDVTEPARPFFVGYTGNRDYSADAESAEAGDLGPESIVFIPAAESPIRRHSILVANEVSGTVSLYDLSHMLDDALTGLTATAADRDQINLGFAAAPGADAIVIERRTINGIWNRIAEVAATATSYTDSGLQPATVYEYRVFARTGNTYSLTGQIETESSFFALSVFHNNDGESKLINAGSGKEAFGGIARFVALLEQMRAATATDGFASVTLSSGDNFLAGTAFSASLDSGTFYDAIGLSAIGYDAIQIGNHDFDFGPDVLADFISQVTGNVPYLAANLGFSGEPALQALVAADRIAPFTVIERNGRRIGVVGAVTPILPTISSPGAVTVDSDIRAAVQARVDELTADGVDIVILISHLQSIAEDKALIPTLRNVDIAIAGGGDDLLANEGDLLIPGETAVDVYPVLVNDADGQAVPVVTTAGEYKYLGMLDTVFNHDGRLHAFGGGPIRVSGIAPDAVTADAQVQADAVDPVVAFSAALAANVIATSQVALDGTRNNVRTRETNEGNLIADSLLWQANKLAADFGAPEAHIALQNGGGIRNNTLIPAGDITELNTFDMVPFANFVTIVRDITPAKLREILENAVSRVEFGDGRFAQIAGFRMTIDLAQTAGNRVRSAILDNGTVLVSGGITNTAAGTVNIATIDFLARGGDSYPFGDAAFTNLGVTYQQALYAYIVNELNGVIRSADYPEGGEGRIARILPPVVAPAWYPELALAPDAARASNWYEVQIFAAGNLSTPVFTTRKNGDRLLPADYFLAGFGGLLPGSYVYRVRTWQPATDTNGDWRPASLSEPGSYAFTVAYGAAEATLFGSPAINAVSDSAVDLTFTAQNASGYEIRLRGPNGYESVRRTLFAPKDDGSILANAQTTIRVNLPMTGSFAFDIRTFNPVDVAGSLPAFTEFPGGPVSVGTLDTPVAPGAVTRMWPADGTIIVPEAGNAASELSLAWDPVTGADGYIVHAIGPNGVILNFFDTGSATTATTTITPGVYRWMVLAYRSVDGERLYSAWSASAGFIVANDLKAPLLAGVIGVGGGQIQVTWHADGGAATQVDVSILSLDHDTTWHDLGRLAIGNIAGQSGRVTLGSLAQRTGTHVIQLRPVTADGRIGEYQQFIFTVSEAP